MAKPARKNNSGDDSGDAIQKSTRTKPSTTSQAKAPRRSKKDHADQVSIDSIQKQKELFEKTSGRGSWDRNYTPLQEIQNNTSLVRRFPAAEARRVTREVWDSIDSKSFKIGQELFSNARDAVVPGNLREISKSETPHVVPKKDNPAMHSQLGALYTRVSIAFATTTGILSEKKRTAREIVEASADIKVVTQAKYLMDCIQPIGNRAPKRPNAVVLAISLPPSRVIKNYEKAFAELGITPPHQAVGSILYLRRAIESTESKEFPPKRTAQVFATIYDAMRKTYHEEHQYEAEQTKASELKNAWEQFARVTLPHWISERELTARLDRCSSDRERARVRDECESSNNDLISSYRGLLEQTGAFLESSIHPEKQDVADRIVRMKARLESSPSGRLNPNPVLAQVEANFKRLQERLDDINIKNSYNTNDRALLLEKIKAEFTVLDTVHCNLLSRAHRLEGNESVFRRSFDKPMEAQREMNSLFWKVRLPRPDSKGSDKSLATIQVRPFTTFRDAIEECGRALESSARPGGFESAKESLATMFLVTRAFKAQAALEAVRVGLSRSDKPWAGVINEARQKLAELQERDSLFRAKIGLERSDYSTSFSALCSNLKGTLEMIATSELALSTREISRNQGMQLAEARDALREQARQALQAFNFESFVRSLPLRTN